MSNHTAKDREDFNSLVELAMREEGFSHMRPVVEKELLHYDLLFVLDKNKLLDKLTFQGGTSLRLCYGAPRLSEDLDFVGGYDFSTADLNNMKSCIEDYIVERYGLEISVKEPSDMSKETAAQNIKVDKWQIAIITSPSRKDIPKQKIKLEVCNVPAYTRSPLALQTNYRFLPDGYDDILVMTEDLDEIMADKLISLVNTTRYVRHRDIWDLRWLKQQGARLNKELVLAKIDDYKITNYLALLDKMTHRVSEIIYSREFYNELSRFIPQEVQNRTLNKDKFKEYLINETRLLLRSLQQQLDGQTDHDEFYIE